MPTQGEPIGPYPPGVESDEARSDYDKERRRVLWKMPSGLYVIGSRDGLRRNGMTANWVTQVSSDPKLVGVSVETAALTHELITASQAFSINILDREDRGIIRKFTKPVEVDAEAKTMNGFKFHDGVSGAPILDQALGFVDCAVHESLAIGSHTLFIGEIVDAGFQLDEETEVLRMEDTRMNYGG